MLFGVRIPMTARAFLISVCKVAAMLAPPGNPYGGSEVHSMDASGISKNTLIVSSKHFASFSSWCEWLTKSAIEPFLGAELDLSSIDFLLGAIFHLSSAGTHSGCEP
jgi:hypothetical protein